MKYFPLVWAALWRRPARLILTLLSVVVAFVLFGVTIGISASYAHIAELAHLNRVYVYPRFGSPLPIALGQQLSRLSGVTDVGAYGFVSGYFQDKKNPTFVLMLDPRMREIATEYPLTPQQWDQLFATRTGVFVSRARATQFHLKPGDMLPIVGLAPKRQDGSSSWGFNVLGVVDDIPQSSNGFILGNYDYLDEARAAALRGNVNGFQILIQDPDQGSAMAKAIDAQFASSATPTRSISEKAQQEGASQAGLNIPFITEAVAGAGLFMILFLTGNCIAQSVRERIPEFAVLKTLGFSDNAVMALVFVEAVIPCLLGAGIGLFLATLLAAQLPLLLPPNTNIPIPYMAPSVLLLALGFAVLVAIASAVLPALRIKRLNVVAALMGR